MTFEDFALARQVLVEEFVGSRIREAAAVEEAQARATAKAIRGK